MNTTSHNPPSPQKTSGLAITALVLGCLVFFLGCLTGIPAIIVGIIALVRLDKNPNLSGRGMAIAGLVLGGISLFITALLAGLAVPAISTALDRAKMTQEVAEIRQVGLLAFSYANDHNGRYPDSLDVLADEYSGSSEDKARLFYKPGTQEYRWILTPDLTVNDPPDTPLLKTARPHTINQDRGQAIYTVGNLVFWDKQSP
ncbi:MAG: DUF4190 domain-containing protein [Blastochloris sp.]|nr:DUF4190 domain-containing protein [Blastochloris sp.]